MKITIVLIACCALNLAALILLIFRREWTEGAVVIMATMYMIVGVSQSWYADEWKKRCNKLRELCEQAHLSEIKEARK